MAKLKKSIRVPTSLNTNRIESKLWKESKDKKIYYLGMVKIAI